MQGTALRGVRKARSCGSDSRVGFSQLPFWCFAVLILKTELPPLAATCLVLGRGREGRRGDGEGSNEPSVLEGSLASDGGHSGWGPAFHFARLATRLLLPHGLQSQVTGDDAGGGLGRL